MTAAPDRPHEEEPSMSTTATRTPSPAAPPDRSAALVAVTTAVLFTGAFTLLGVTFDYPAVLDESPAEILTRYADAGLATRALWYVMLVASLAFVPLAVLLGRSVGARLPRPSALTEVAVVVGVLAGLVQAVGFARWTFAVPYLADTFADPASSPATRDAIVVVFEVLHRFVGGALGEHLGFALTAVWTVSVAVLLARVPAAPRLLVPTGLVAGAAVATGVAEVTGATWPSLPVAGGYLLFAAWLVGIGVLLLGHRLGRPVAQA
jgi:hypothetical protein